MADWRPSLVSAVVYRDPKAALKFLEAAFGFELFMLIEDDQGNVAHSEMRFGDAAIMIGFEWSDEYKSPASLGGKVTQSVHIQVAGDIDAHCERARAAGMEILMAPADQFYGDRTGTVGVLGPTRMRYRRAISVVDSVSQVVTRLLEGQ